MTKSTLTLTQSGLLAVLLEHQRRKVTERAQRRAHREHLRSTFCNTLTRAFRAITGRAPTNDSEKHFAGTVPRRI
jgi:hypothetical protein